MGPRGRADVPGQYGTLCLIGRKLIITLLRNKDVQAIHASARNDFPDAPEDGDPRLLRNRLGAKIWCGCDYARARGYPYLWIDSCCIDKTSSAELSEAINSMFDWYSQAAVCYVFLFDVSAG